MIYLMRSLLALLLVVVAGSAFAVGPTTPQVLFHGVYGAVAFDANSNSCADVVAALDAAFHAMNPGDTNQFQAPCFSTVNGSPVSEFGPSDRDVMGQGGVTRKFPGGFTSQVTFLLYSLYEPAVCPSGTAINSDGTDCIDSSASAGIDWQKSNHLLQALFIAVCGLSFGLGVMAGQQR